jgi:putative FmdB family regulatory protein
MPRYDYKCNDCGNVQEEQHPMAGPENPVECVKCKSKNIEKTISASYVQFIGDWQTNQVRKI